MVKTGGDPRSWFLQWARYDRSWSRHCWTARSSAKWRRSKHGATLLDPSHSPSVSTRDRAPVGYKASLIISACAFSAAPSPRVAARPSEFLNTTKNIQKLTTNTNTNVFEQVAIGAQLVTGVAFIVSQTTRSKHIKYLGHDSPTSRQ